MWPPRQSVHAAMAVSASARTKTYGASAGLGSMLSISKPNSILSNRLRERRGTEKEGEQRKRGNRERRGTEKEGEQRKKGNRERREQRKKGTEKEGEQRKKKRRLLREDGAP